MPYASHLAVPRRARGGRCCEPGDETILEHDDPPTSLARPGTPPSRAPAPRRNRNKQMSASRAATNGLPATDPEALSRLERFGGRKLMHEMIALYLKGASERLAAAARGVAANDAPAAENAFHALKSSSAQLGAARLASLCEQGEAIARTRTLDSLREVLDASRHELLLVEAWLDGVRAEGPA